MPTILSEKTRANKTKYVAKVTDGIIGIANGIGKISDVASNNAAATEEQASSISEVLSLSGIIVAENDKLRKAFYGFSCRGECHSLISSPEWTYLSWSPIMPFITSKAGIPVQWQV